MHLSKYPVTTSMGTYHVDVKTNDYYHFKCLEVTISNKTDRKPTIFNKSTVKYEVLYGTEFGWSHYHDNMKDLIGTVKSVISKYEETIRNAVNRKLEAQDSIEKFIDWDGKVSPV